MAGCCLYGAFLMGMFLRQYDVVNSLRLSDPVTEEGLSGNDDHRTERSKLLPGLARVETFTVSGMTCASCAQAVEAGIAGVAGVTRANVDALLGRAEVVYDRTRTKRAHIVDAVESAGFAAEVANGESKASRGNFRARLARWNYGDAFTWSLFCISPIVALEALPATDFLPWQRRQLYVLILSGFVQFGFGMPFHRRLLLACGRTQTLSMDVLVSLATSAAYAASVMHFIRGDSTSYASMSASLISVLSLSKHLESRAKTTIADTLRAFDELVPSFARLLRAGTVDTIPVGMLRHGDAVLVSAGERFPCDGRLDSPDSAEYAQSLEVDESVQTGEARPVVKNTGEFCLAGTLNAGPLPAVLTIQSPDEATQRLADLLGTLVQAQQYKSDLQTVVEKAASFIVPVTLAASGLSFLWWFYVEGFDTALLSLIATLVVACPCALGLSTPAALMMAISVSSEHGAILKRGAQAVEALSKTTTFVFDKTGTLTTGQMKLQRWSISPSLPKNLRSEHMWWQLLYGAEYGVQHWAAQAVIEHMTATLNSVAAQRVPTSSSAIIVPGRGLSRVVNGVSVVVGNEAHLRAHGVDDPLLRKDMMSLEASESCVLVAYDRQYAGVVTFCDQVAQGVVETIARLAKRGVEVCMMTGDRETVAAEVAQVVGIEKLWSEQTPGDKSNRIKALQQGGQIVAMVGDGINDALALGTADIGIALHSGSPLAVASADLVLLRSSITQIEPMIDVAHAVHLRVKANVAWALLYNVLLIPLCMGFGRPWGFTLHPTLAGTLMMGSSLGVTYNSIRLGQRLRVIFKQYGRGGHTQG